MVDMDSVVQVDFHFSQELQWFRCGHVFFMLEALSKNKGLVNQGRSDVTIVSSNAPQALKRYYTKLKCT